MHNRMPAEQGGTAGGLENHIGSRTSVPLPLHLPPQHVLYGGYGPEYSRMESWLDENPEFVQDYFIR